MPGSARARSLRSPSARPWRRSKACRSISLTSPRELDRGKRSGIGIGTFGQGGAVLDGGPSNGHAAAGALRAFPSPRMARAAHLRSGSDRPAWRAKRRRPSRSLPDFPQTETGGALRGAFCSARFPAIAESDFKTFCDEVGYLQQRDGRLFRADCKAEPMSAGASRPRSAGSCKRRPHRARPKLMGADRLCLCRLRGRGPSLLSVARAHAGRAGLLHFELARAPQRSCYLSRRG